MTISSPLTTAEVAAHLLPCPFCGGAASIVENRMRMTPRMDGKYKEPAILSVSIQHHCPRHTDERGNYAVLGHYTEVRGRDHAAAVAAWNGRTSS